MKTSFYILVTLLISYNVMSQNNIEFGGSIRIGYASKQISGFVSPALYVGYKGFVFSPELVINAANDASVDAGAKISYNVMVNHEWDIRAEIGLCRYYMAYSLDKYDAYRNHWSNGLLFNMHLKKYFGGIQYLNKEVSYYIGVRQAF